MKTVKILIAAISMYLIYAILAGVVFLSYTMGQFTLDDVRDHDVWDLEDIDIPPEDEVDPELLPPVEIEPGQPVRDPAIINILLVGSDAEDFSRERGRTDAMLVATIDTRNRQLKLTSFLRDTWVNIPGTDRSGRPHRPNRLNVAFPLGDANLLMQTIEHNFNIDINFFVVVNLSLFSLIIDNHIGGVEFNLPENDAIFLRNQRAAGPNRENITVGTNRLTGRQALEFVRIRHINYVTQDASGNRVVFHSDFGRTARQRDLLQALFVQMRNQDIRTLINIATSSLENTRHNIPARELGRFISIALNFGVNDIKQLQIPYAGAFENRTMPSGAQVLFVSEQNMQRNRDRLRNFIFERQ